MANSREHKAKPLVEQILIEASPKRRRKKYNTKANRKLLEQNFEKPLRVNHHALYEKHRQELAKKESP